MLIRRFWWSIPLAAALLATRARAEDDPPKRKFRDTALWTEHQEKRHATREREEEAREASWHRYRRHSRWHDDDGYAYPRYRYHSSGYPRSSGRGWYGGYGYGGYGYGGGYGCYGYPSYGSYYRSWHYGYGGGYGGYGGYGGWYGGGCFSTFGRGWGFSICW